MTSRLSPGDGRIVCATDNLRRALFEEVAFSYPLKLLVPKQVVAKRRDLQHVQSIYVISYGGGLVAGDRVRLKVEVRSGTTLVMLTQGSTKVFRTRPDRYLSAPSFITPSSSTEQLYRLSVSPSSLLVLLPSPVTCFSRSRYNQRQVVHLADETSSVLLLDWYTSGRMGMDDKEKGKGAESWEFERYESVNEVWAGGRRIAKDALVLEDEDPPGPKVESEGQNVRLYSADGSASPLPAQPSAAKPPQHATTYSSRVSPYTCYCTLFLFGPHTAPLLASLQRTFTSITQYKQSRPYSLVWSYSPLQGHPGGGGIARAAGATTEEVKEWVVHVLEEGGIAGLVGEDSWKTAFN
ncbi:hypothetical protein JCM8547_009342 [Rhodosporidiobolus lusitaniae]